MRVVCLALIVWCGLHEDARAQRRELTPVDALQTTRLVGEALTDGTIVRSYSISPSGERYLVRLIRGAARENRVELELWTGELSSLDAAARPRMVARFYTRGLGARQSGVGGDLDPLPNNRVRWLDDDRVLFLWADHQNHRQILEVNLRTRRSTSRTSAPNSVGMFAAAQNGTIIFNVQEPPAPSAYARQVSDGFYLPETVDLWSVVNDSLDGTRNSALNRSTWYIRYPSGQIAQLEINGARVDQADLARRNVEVSPDGRWALLETAFTEASSWRGYDDSFVQRALNAQPVGDPFRFLPVQYTLIDLATRTSRKLWDAPRPAGGRASWSPDSEWLALAPTFLPLADISPGRRTGSAAVALNVETGRYFILPVSLQSQSVQSIRWTSTGRLILNLQDAQGTTEEISISMSDQGAERVARTPSPSRVELYAVQDLNTPPRLFARDMAAGNDVEIFDPNPALRSDFRLGRVERIRGPIPGTNAEYVANLTYPVEYTGGQVYPLVIQSSYGRGSPPNSFTLSGEDIVGDGLGPSLLPAYVSQLLSSRGIFVAQMNVVTSAATEGSEEASLHMRGFEALIERLSHDHLIDPMRVGLSGFSRNGYYVEYALTHSTFPYATAMVGDNYSTSYTQSAFRNWPDIDREAVGAEPFGEGLQVWLRESTGFNYDRIRAPLLIVQQSAGLRYGVLMRWELVTRMRHAGRLAELYVMPDIDEHPSHGPQSPRQILAIQENVLDWFDYWLNGEIDPDPAKQPLYLRWRAHRASQ